MTNDAAVLLLRAGKKPGDVFECKQRDIKRVAKTDEARALVRCIDVQHSGKKGRLISNYANRFSIEPGEADDDVLRI